MNVPAAFILKLSAEIPVALSLAMTVPQVVTGNSKRLERYVCKEQK